MMGFSSKVRRGAAAVGVGLWLCALPAFGLSAEEQLRFADGIYLRGLYEAAVGEYLAFVKEYPQAPELPAALFRLAESYRHLGNLTGADLFYRRVVSEFAGSPYAARAGIRQAEALLAAGEAKPAAERFEALLASGAVPEDMQAAALYYLGNSRMRAKQRKAAVEAFERLLAAWPESPYAAYASLDLAAMEGMEGKPEEMTRHFQQAVKSAATPGARAEALFRWGDWAYRRGDYQTAADTFHVLVTELPEQKRAVDARLAAAWCLFYLERPAEALELAEAAQESAPDGEVAAAAIYLQANCLRAMNRDGEAIALYEDILADFPKTEMAPRAGYEIMLTEFRRGRWQAALDAAPLNPAAGNEADILWMRAEAYRALGQPLPAKRDYDAIGSRFPDSPQQALALMRLAEMARAEGDSTGAAKLFAAAAAHPAAGEETSATAWEASARAEMSAGDAAAALKAWDARLAMKPEGDALAEALLQKALVQLAVKKPDDALRTLDELVATHPSAERLAQAAYWRGVILTDKEDYVEAERILRGCLAGNPEASLAALARLRLTLVLQRLDKMNEAADQMAPLVADAALVAENPALVEWYVMQRFDQARYADAAAAAEALAKSAEESSWRQLGWYWAGLSRRELGEQEKSRRAFRAVVDIPLQTREKSASLLMLAGLELAAGETAAAQADFRAAAENALEDEVDIRVRAYFGLAETAEALGDDEAAARHYMSVAILFDEPEVTPRALAAAAGAYDRLGKTALRDAARADLRARYPESSYARQLGDPRP